MRFDPASTVTGRRIRRKRLRRRYDFNPAGGQQLHVRRAAAIQYGDFQVVDLNVGVVHAHAIENAEQMLGGGDHHALPHQAGGIADTRDIAPKGGDGEIVKISAEKDDAGGRGGGENPNRDGNAAVKSYAFGLYRPLDRGLKPQSGFLWVVQFSRFAR